MLPRRIIFATNVSTFSGAGHIRRLIEISKALPATFEKYFFGSIEIEWVKEMARRSFLPLDSQSETGPDDLVIIDSYDERFCLVVNSKFSDSRIIQIADRYTFLLPDSKIVYMDLPFSYQDSKTDSRVIAHGIDYLPMRRFARKGSKFTKKAKRVLVTTGGSTNERIFSQLVEEVANGKYNNVSFEFIGGYESIRPQYTNLNFHDYGNGFDSIVRICDTAISAAGTTMWDLFANNKLVGLVSLVDNQAANFDYATRSRLALNVFNPKNLELDVAAFQSLLFDSNIRQSLYGETFGKYDFNGAKRVVEVIFKSL